jgi:purine-binding chemotaxis protein CheW
MHVRNASAAPAGAEPAAIEDQQHQVLTFLVAEELYGVPILAVQEIRGWERATVLPRSAGHVRGVINLRGHVVPVLDVRHRFGLEVREPDAETVLIVVQVSHGGRLATVGLVVDGVSDVVEVENDSVRPAPEVCGAQARDFVRGIAPLDTRMLLLLDLDALVGEVPEAA